MKSSLSKKIISLGLLTAFLTNCVFAHAIETTVWQQRRGTLKPKPKPVQLASAALPRLSPFSAIKIPAVPTLSRSVSLESQTKLPIPSTVQLRGVYPSSPLASTRQAPLLIQIQDVHRNAEAQANISAAVRELIEKHGVDFLAAEGAFAPLDLSDFKTADAAVLKKAAGSLLDEKEMSGALHGVLTANRAADFIGVDDSRHYEANVTAYQESSRAADRVRGQLADAQKDLNIRMAAELSPPLWAFQQRSAAYEKGKLGLPAFIRFLQDAAPELPLSLRAYAEAARLEAAMDERGVEDERRRLLETLVARLSAGESKELAEKSAAVRAGRISLAQFYSGLLESCRSKKIDVEKFPKMASYARYVALVDGLKVEELFADIRSAQEEAYKRLIKTTAQRELVEKGRFFQLAEKLAGFSLTKEEWKEYGLIKFQITSSKFQAKDKQEKNKRLEIGNSEFVWNLAFGAWDLSSFEDFYREAEARDDAMAENIARLMEKRKTGVVVAGGFHSNGLTERLTKKGITVVTVSPKLTQVDLVSGSAYLSVFNQEKTPLDKIFEGQKLFLTEREATPARLFQLAERLASLEGAGRWGNATPRLRKLVSKTGANVWLALWAGPYLIAFVVTRAGLLLRIFRFAGKIGKFFQILILASILSFALPAPLSRTAKAQEATPAQIAQERKTAQKYFQGETADYANMTREKFIEKIVPRYLAAKGQKELTAPQKERMEKFLTVLDLFNRLYQLPPERLPFREGGVILNSCDRSTLLLSVPYLNIAGIETTVISILPDPKNKDITTHTYVSFSPFEPGDKETVILDLTPSSAFRKGLRSAQADRGIEESLGPVVVFNSDLKNLNPAGGQARLPQYDYISQPVRMARAWSEGDVAPGGGLVLRNVEFEESFLGLENVVSQINFPHRAERVIMFLNRRTFELDYWFMPFQGQPGPQVGMYFKPDLTREDFIVRKKALRDDDEASNQRWSRRRDDVIVVKGVASFDLDKKADATRPYVLTLRLENGAVQRHYFDAKGDWLSMEEETPTNWWVWIGGAAGLILLGAGAAYKYLKKKPAVPTSSQRPEPPQQQAKGRPGRSGLGNAMWLAPLVLAVGAALASAAEKGARAFAQNSSFGLGVMVVVLAVGMMMANSNGGFWSPGGRTKSPYDLSDPDLQRIYEYSGNVHYFAAGFEDFMKTLFLPFTLTEESLVPDDFDIEEARYVAIDALRELLENPKDPFIRYLETDGFGREGDWRLGTVVLHYLDDDLRQKKMQIPLPQPDLSFSKTYWSEEEGHYQTIFTPVEVKASLAFYWEISPGRTDPGRRRRPLREPSEKLKRQIKPRHVASGNTLNLWWILDCIVNHRLAEKLPRNVREYVQAYRDSLLRNVEAGFPASAETMQYEIQAGRAFVINDAPVPPEFEPEDFILVKASKREPIFHDAYKPLVETYARLFNHNDPKRAAQEWIVPGMNERVFIEDLLRPAYMIALIARAYEQRQSKIEEGPTMTLPEMIQYLEVADSLLHRWDINVFSPNDRKPAVETRQELMKELLNRWRERFKLAPPAPPAKKAKEPAKKTPLTSRSNGANRPAAPATARRPSVPRPAPGADNVFYSGLIGGDARELWIMFEVLGLPNRITPAEFAQSILSPNGEALFGLNARLQGSVALQQYNDSVPAAIEAAIVHFFQSPSAYGRMDGGRILFSSLADIAHNHGDQVVDLYNEMNAYALPFNSPVVLRPNSALDYNQVVEGGASTLRRYPLDVATPAELLSKGRRVRVRTEAVVGDTGVNSINFPPVLHLEAGRPFRIIRSEGPQVAEVPNGGLLVFQSEFPNGNGSAVFTGRVFFNNEWVQAEIPFLSVDVPSVVDLPAGTHLTILKRKIPVHLTHHQRAVLIAENRDGVRKYSLPVDGHWQLVREEENGEEPVPLTPPDTSPTTPPPTPPVLPDVPSETPARPETSRDTQAGKTAEADSFDKKEEVPGSDIVVESIPFEIKKIFEKDAPLTVEIGFGLGEALDVESTKNDGRKGRPLRNYLGIESSLLLSKVDHLQGRSNLRISYGRAEKILMKIADGQVDEFIIVFPYPLSKESDVVDISQMYWLFEGGFYRKLRPGGRVVVVTEHDDTRRYAEWKLRDHFQIETLLIKEEGQPFDAENLNERVAYPVSHTAHFKQFIEKKNPRMNAVIATKPLEKETPVLLASHRDKRGWDELKEMKYFRPVAALSVVVVWIMFALGIQGPLGLAVILVLAVFLDFLLSPFYRQAFIRLHDKNSYQAYLSYGGTLSFEDYQREIGTAHTRLNNETFVVYLIIALTLSSLFLVLSLAGIFSPELSLSMGATTGALFAAASNFRRHLKRNDEFREKGPMDGNQVLLSNSDPGRARNAALRGGILSKIEKEFLEKFLPFLKKTLTESPIEGLNEAEVETFAQNLSGNVLRARADVYEAWKNFGLFDEGSALYGILNRRPPEKEMAEALVKTLRKAMENPLIKDSRTAHEITIKSKNPLSRATLLIETVGYLAGVLSAVDNDPQMREEIITASKAVSSTGLQENLEKVVVILKQEMGRISEEPASIKKQLLTSAYQVAVTGKEGINALILIIAHFKAEGVVFKDLSEDLKKQWLIAVYCVAIKGKEGSAALAQSIAHFKAEGVVYKELSEDLKKQWLIAAYEVAMKGKEGSAALAQSIAHFKAEGVVFKDLSEDLKKQWLIAAYEVAMKGKEGNAALAQGIAHLKAEGVVYKDLSADLKKQWLIAAYEVAKKGKEGSAALAQGIAHLKAEGVVYKDLSADLKKQWLIAAYEVAKKGKEGSAALAQNIAHFKGEGVVYKDLSEDLKKQWLIALYEVAMKEGSDALILNIAHFKAAGVIYKDLGEDLKKQWLIAVYNVTIEGKERSEILKKILEKLKSLRKFNEPLAEWLKIIWRLSVMENGRELMDREIGPSYLNLRQITEFGEWSEQQRKILDGRLFSKQKQKRFGILASHRDKRGWDELKEMKYFRPILGLSIVASWVLYIWVNDSTVILAGIALAAMIDLLSGYWFKKAFVLLHMNSKAYEHYKKYIRWKPRMLSQSGYLIALGREFERMNDETMFMFFKIALPLAVSVLLGGKFFEFPSFKCLALSVLVVSSIAFIVAWTVTYFRHLWRNDAFRKDGPTEENPVLMSHSDSGNALRPEAGENEQVKAWLHDLGPVENAGIRQLQAGAIGFRTAVLNEYKETNGANVESSREELTFGDAAEPSFELFEIRSEKDLARAAVAAAVLEKRAGNAKTGVALIYSGAQAKRWAAKASAIPVLARGVKSGRVAAVSPTKANGLMIDGENHLPLIDGSGILALIGKKKEFAWILDGSYGRVRLAVNAVTPLWTFSTLNRASVAAFVIRVIEDAESVRMDVNEFMRLMLKAEAAARAAA